MRKITFQLKKKKKKEALFQLRNNIYIVQIQGS